MNFVAFQKAFQDDPVIDVHEVQKAFPQFQARRLSDWQEKAYVQKIINRFYRWPDQPVTEEAAFYTANQVYRDSYVSLWSALSHYQLIPEGVFRTYSVSTHKTKSFATPLGELIYRHVKPSLFFGYRLDWWQGHPLLIAEPEKALLDTIYLHPHWTAPADIDALRLNWFILNEVAQPAVLQAYAPFYTNERVSNLTDYLIEQMTHA